MHFTNKLFHGYILRFFFMKILLSFKSTKYDKVFKLFFLSPLNLIIKFSSFWKFPCENYIDCQYARTTKSYLSLEMKDNQVLLLGEYTISCPGDKSLHRMSERISETL